MDGRVEGALLVMEDVAEWEGGVDGATGKEQLIMEGVRGWRGGANWSWRG
jgi:hypothetical protein